MYDAMVVGAGPAGASAAYELAWSGARILLLERQTLPRYKACGGAIPFNFFQTLPLRVQKTLETILNNGVYLASPHKNFRPQITAKVAGVMRDRFDYEFAQAAVEEGAELIDGLPVRRVEEKERSVSVKTDKGSFEARYLIGADGATGGVKRFLGLGRQEPAAPALEVEISPRGEATRGDLTLVHFTLIRDGYAWVFPKGGVDSVGIASFGRDRKKVKTKLAEWAALCGYRLEGKIVHGHPIPVWRGRSTLASRRSLLVGDAAATVDPLGGEGIRHGILSGRIAARHVCQALAHDAFLPSAYTEEIYQSIQADFLYAARLAAFFYRFPGFCFDLWVRTHAATDLVGKVLYGELRYQDLFRLAVRSLLRLKNYKCLFSSSGAG